MRGPGEPLLAPALGQVLGAAEVLLKRPQRPLSAKVRFGGNIVHGGCGYLSLSSDLEDRLDRALSFSAASISGAGIGRGQATHYPLAGSTAPHLLLVFVACSYDALPVSNNYQARKMLIIKALLKQNVTFRARHCPLEM